MAGMMGNVFNRMGQTMPGQTLPPMPGASPAPQGVQFSVTIALFITLAGTIAVGSKNSGGGTPNIRIASGILFVLVVTEQIIFCFVPFHMTPYIIVTGVLTPAYVLIAIQSERCCTNGAGLSGKQHFRQNYKQKSSLRLSGGTS